MPARRIVVIAANARSLAVNRRSLIEGWLDAGHEVVALIPESDADPEWLALVPVPFRLVPLGRVTLNPWRDFVALLHVVRRLRVLKPDIVFSYAAKPILYGALAARASGVRHQFALFTGLGYLFSANSVRARLLRSLLLPLYRRVLRWQERVFFQNPDDLALMRQYGVLRDVERCTVVDGSGVDVDEFPFVRAPTTPVTFLLMARLIRDKGIDLFVTAATRLASGYPEARFIVMGALDPSLPGSIDVATLERWRTNSPVEFPGYEMDVRGRLATASVFVLPSTYREGVPRSILEALATGRAVITTDSPGCRETVLHGKNGYLIPTNDVGALTRAMESFLLEPDRITDFGRASRVLAETRFDVRNVTRIMLHAMGLRA